MNTATAPLARAPVRTPWYRVPEVWLMVVLLGATVLGSFALIATAVQHPDAHITVPNDVPRPSKVPPSDPPAVPAPARR